MTHCLYSYPSTSSESATRSKYNYTDQLRAPKLSELSRKRKIHSNPAPPTGKKRSVTQQKKALSVKPSQRVCEFSGEHLCVSAGNLFCKACRETVAIKRSVVQGHLKSRKH